MANLSEILHEYRIRLPFTLEEYKIGQLYTVAEVSKRENGGGEGWKWVKNDSFEGVVPGDDTGMIRKGQFTHKILYLASKFPKTYRCLSRQQCFEIHEKCWNCFPYVYTEYTNPSYMEDNFHMTITSMHKEGTQIDENVHGIPNEKRKERTTELLDIVNDFSDVRDYNSSEDPTTYISTKSSRGPLKGSYWIHDQPVSITCYKLIRIGLNWKGWEQKMSEIILKVIRRTLLRFNRQVFCLMDDWLDLTLEDIRHREEKVKKELDELRDEGTMMGTRET